MDRVYRQGLFIGLTIITKAHWTGFSNPHQKLVMGSDGYTEPSPTRTNPGLGALSLTVAAPIISGAVAATTAFFIGRMWEKKENQTGIDNALENLSAQQHGKLEKMLEKGFRIMTITNKKQ